MDDTSSSHDRGPIRRRLLWIVGGGLAVVGLSSVGVLAFRWIQFDDALTAQVTRGALRVHLTESGVLQPSQSITYRSPLTGRESEIVVLAPEGTLVQKGDLIVRLDTSDLERELERSMQNLQQAQVDVTIATLDRDEAATTLEALERGESTLAADEEQFRLELAEKRVVRLRAELESLQPLLDRGFITREELDRIAFELEQAEAEASIARRKNEVFLDSTQPREVQRTQRLLAQRQAQLDNASAKLDAAKSQVAWLNSMIARCSIYARQPGLVIHEEYLVANPRRKIRLGDRVTSSQGLVTIPEVGHMVVETSVREADVHAVQPGQPATIRLDAFPEARLTGSIRRVGTMARNASSQLFEDKRFDVIVEVDPTEIDLRPEMTARVDILVEELPDVLMAPVNAVFERDGSYVAHVATPWRLRTATVALGASNGVFVEVKSGLDAGDRLHLQDVVTGEASEVTVPASAPEPARGKNFAPR